MSQYFHFTLGPVQSFVAQARRTRDFWSGSFLLSWLAGIAMQEVEQQGGVILFPEADSAFLEAIKGSSGSTRPSQGNIPNRFKAKVTDTFEPERVVSAVNQAWEALAAVIYQKDLERVTNPNTKLIWDRQVQNFWDMSWVIVAEESNSAALDQRKNIRSLFVPQEPGIKCTLMADWQELSGIEGVRSTDRQQREAFWQKVSQHIDTKLDFQSEGKEHLCALSFIKRRFYAHFANFKTELNGWTVHGWDVEPAVPSVAYLAGVRWWTNVLATAPDDEFSAFAESAKALNKLPERDTKIKSVIEVATQKNRLAYTGIDGNTFHEITLDNPNKTQATAQAIKVKQALKQLQKKFGKASPFYAVLMMDGDQLGKQMSDLTKQKDITQGLQKFIANVPTIIEKHNGFLIYAGGDDVLALLPMETAIECAVEVRAHYQHTFKAFPKLQTTISAALVYTHINHSLKNVLLDAHRVLDEIAKDGAGRDALAVTVYKGSGQVIEWARKWDKLLVNNQLVISQLVSQFKQVSDKLPLFSSKFFYGIREKFSVLKDVTTSSQQKNSLLSFEDAVTLLSAQFIQSADNLKILKDIFTGVNLQDTARQFTRPLLEQCQDASKGEQITADFALFVRFLAQKGLEERGV
ncbi:type III-B CRISPR-associated protein Cas10/Cmr2 [Pelistega sp. MC2]|uniref:type III-B CRISPR-associated protein Cas10/Cmr2 n=1 Tax=Pelistega sp. MC2 TaxID=1720297 RepID=UPI0008DA151A|nr:type III-B CRISPR-associated protein Cas10/Cmr2 [Pelistega sp. MC2]